MEDKDKKDLALGLAGATPELMSFLFSGPARQVQAIKETQNAFKATAPDKVVNVVGEGGLPEIVDVRDSIGREPYQKTSTKSGANPQTGVGFNKKTGEYQQLIFDPSSSSFTYSDRTPVENSRDWIFKPVKESTYSVEDIGGGKTIKSVNQYTGKADTRSYTPGIGQYLGEEGKPIPKEEAKGYYKGIEKTKEKTAPIEMELNQLSRIKTTLGNPNASKQEVANAIETLKRTAGEKRLSDIESVRAEGDKYATLANYLDDIYTRRVQGKERADKIAGFSALTDNMINEKKSNINSYRNIYTPKTRSKGKAEVESRSFSEKVISPSEKAKNDQLIQILNKLQGL